MCTLVNLNKGAVEFKTWVWEIHVVCSCKSVIPGQTKMDMSPSSARHQLYILKQGPFCLSFLLYTVRITEATSDVQG